MSFLAPSTSEVRRRRILVGGASVLITAVVMTGFILESRWGYSPKDLNIIYMQNWSADRSREQTRADTAGNTRRAGTAAGRFPRLYRDAVGQGEGRRAEAV